MLDLDSLAEKRAKSVNEQEDKWRSTLWSENFQKLVKNMSDGEIEELLQSCPSVAHLERVVHFLKTHEDSPFASLQNAAREGGLSLVDWIRKLQ